MDGSSRNFSGFVPEFPHVSLDKFTSDHMNSTLYFLSHLHTDHCQGLNSQQLRYRLEAVKDAVLVAHATTCQLVKNSKAYAHLDKFLRPLEYGCETTFQVVDPKTGKTSYRMEVVLFDANHCPGAAMLLLKSDEARILYTGDFRASESVVGTLAPLLTNLDNVYIDTTFACSEKPVFPSQEASMQGLADLTAGWLKEAKENRVYISVMCSLGYEELFRSLFYRFGQKIHFCQGQLDLYRNIPDLQGFSTSHGEDTRLHAGLGARAQCGKGLSCGCTLDNRVLVIEISARRFLENGRKGIKTVEKKGEKNYQVFYSFHSSPSEMESFLKEVAPRKITPNMWPKGLASRSALKAKLASLSRKEPDATETPRLLGELKIWRKAADAIPNSIHTTNSSSDEELDFGQQ